MKEIQIIGAGLSGMTAGISLAKEGYRVIISDAQEGIGGSADLHPSVHTTPAQLDELIEYIGIDLKKDFNKCDPYPYLYYNKKELKLPPYVKYNEAFCIERGPRPSSIDNHLFSIAKDAGVEFEFNKRFDFSKKVKPDTIVASGLNVKGYEKLGVKYVKVYGIWSHREISDQSATGYILMGPFATEYGYTARANGLDYCLLFSRDPIREKDLTAFKKVLDATEQGGYPEPWRNVVMAVPADTNLFMGDMILAGTLSGMIEPFWGYGIVGAIISGKVAAKAVINRDEAVKDFESFTWGFHKKLQRRQKISSHSSAMRAFMTKAGIAWFRLKCKWDKELASNPREPLRWFR